MENGRMDKGKWGGVFLVVLIAAAMLLAGLAIYYHNKVGGYTEENAAYREAADRMMATAFLDIRREMSGDRETALEMSRNFDQAEFSHCCSQLHSGYADEIRMINQIDEMASQKLSGYDAGSLLFYFSDLNDLGQRGLLTQEDADALLGVFDAWESCRWEQLEDDMTAADFDFAEQDYGIAACIDNVRSLDEVYSQRVLADAEE